MNDSDVAYLFFLLLFLAFIGGSYFISRKGQFGQSIQQMAIWCLIFFGFLSVYGLRNTINAELFPEKVVVEQNGSYVFQRDEDGHFYATLKINDIPIKLVVDTGATGLVLTKEDAKLVGLPMDRLVYSQTAYTANGKVASAPVVLHDVRMGNTVHSRMRASVNGGALHSSLLGMEYISEFSEFRIVKDLLYLTP
jgi:aspartyl protease family protein